MFAALIFDWQTRTLRNSRGIVSKLCDFISGGIVVGNTNVEIELLGLSKRSYNCLKRANVNTLEELMKLSEKELLGFRNLGALTLAEIIDVKRKVVAGELQFNGSADNERMSDVNAAIYDSEKTAYAELVDKEKSCLIEGCARIICDDIKDSCPKIKEKSYFIHIKSVLNVNQELLPVNVNEVFENRQLLNAVYSDVTIYKLFEDYVCKVLLELSTLSLFSLKQKMPRGLQNSDIFTEIISKLISDGKLDCTESGLQYHLLTISEYTKLMPEGNQKTALMCRLSGMTLEETGRTMGVTRERARQIIKKVLSKMPRLREDDFKYWFENYCITKEEFKHIFGVTDESYNYLKGTYKRGTKSLEDMLSDDDINGIIAQRVDKELYKYCVVIDGEYVPIRREPIIKKLLQLNFSDKDCHISEFYRLYMDFLKANGLDKNEKLLHPSERAFESRLDDQRYVLTKYGRRIRYYSMDEYDIDLLFLELNFESYVGLEISTLKLFNENKKIMEEFDIRDEYELHNLMKKNQDKLLPFIHLERMPFISVGNSDRERQVIQLLYKIAPIDAYGYGKAYEEEYGVKSETVLANFVYPIDKYYSNGTYSVEYIAMTNDEYRMFGNELTEDFYFIEDVKNVYLGLFPNGDVLKINPFNLKTLGFRVYINYIIRDKYSSSDIYFRKFLKQNDLIDLDSLDKRIMYNSVFTYVLEELRVNFDILEFERNKYVSFERFSKGAPNISKEALRQFTLDVAAFESEEFFTIKSVRRKGFVSDIDNIGFDEWFYSALLRSNKTVHYNKVGGTFLFCHKHSQFKLTDFIYFLMKKFKKISIVKFIDYVYEIYGLALEKSKLAYIINQTNMYYDSTMEKIYLSKDEYYFEVSEGENIEMG